MLADPPLAKPVDAADLSHLRHRVHEDSREWPSVCRELGVTPRVESLTLVHRWITPVAMPKRFDTYFFIAVANEDASIEGSADHVETSRLAWNTPRRLLELFARQEVSLLPPQFYLLATLAGSPVLAEVAAMQAAVVEADVVPWLPEPLQSETGLAMAYPGDWAYPKEDRVQTPLVDKVGPLCRHRLHVIPVERKEGGHAGGKGMPTRGILSGVNTYELERNIPVPFGGEAWGAARTGGRSRPAKL